MNWRVILLASLLVIGAVIQPASGAAAPAADPTWVSSVTIQNLTGSEAHVQVDFYDTNGALVSAATMSGSTGCTLCTIPPNASKVFYIPNTPNLPSGKYSAVVNSDQPVAAIVNLQASGPAMVASYNGVNDTITNKVMNIPVFMNAYYTWNSTAVVQNAGPAESPATNVTVEAFDSAGTSKFKKTEALAAGQSKSYSASGMGLAGGLYSLVVSSPDQPLAVIVNHEATTGKEQSTNAFAPSTATKLYAPIAMNNYYNGWVTSLTVFNQGTADTDVKVTYSGGGLASPLVVKKPVRKGASTLWFQPNDGLPRGWLGSAVVESVDPANNANPGQPIVAVVSQQNDNTGGSSSYNAFLTGSTKINAPVLMKRYYQSSWVTALQVQNIGTGPTDMKVTYSNGAVNTFRNVPAGGVHLFYTPNEAGLSEGWVGGALVESLDPANNANPGQPIVAVVNEENQSSGAGVGDWQMAYNAFNQ